MALVKENEPILKMLADLAQIAQSNGEVHRRRAFLKAIGVLKGYDKPIRSGSQVGHLDGIGKGIQDRIDEFLEKGGLKEIKKGKSKSDVIKEFHKVYGVSDKTSGRWYNMGYRSIKDVRRALKNEEIKMTPIQVASLKYVEEYVQRIPRKEIHKFNEKIERIFHDLKKGGLNIKFKIAGSYLRGAKDSGDIDLLITDKDHKYTDPDILKKVVEILEENNLITHRFKLGKHKFTGLIVIENRVHRQLDIERTDQGTWASALMYFTGNKEFNQCTREIAKNRGYRLNEKGLYKKIKKDKRGTVLEYLGLDEKKLYRNEPLFFDHYQYMAMEGHLWKNMYLGSEKKIFEELDMVYKVPSSRNF